MKTGGNIKGITFVNMQAFVRARGGEAAWDRVRAQVSASDRVVVDESIAVGWYDLNIYLRTLEALPIGLRADKPAVMRDFAKFAAEDHVRGVHRLLLRMANPAYVLEKTAEYWGRFYDCGEWKVTRETPNRARADLFGLFQTTPTLCTFLDCYIEYLFLGVGAKNVRVTHQQCRELGDPFCRYLIEWR